MKKILFFAAVAALFASCGADTTSKTPDYYFDEEVSRLYNDPNAEMDTLSYAMGANLGEFVRTRIADIPFNFEKMESGIVDGFNKVSDKFVEKLFTKEGESVEDAKKRLSGEGKNNA